MIHRFQATCFVGGGEGERQWRRRGGEGGSVGGGGVGGGRLIGRLKITKVKSFGFLEYFAALNSNLLSLCTCVK